jgi:hypothetical protein
MQLPRIPQQIGQTRPRIVPPSGSCTFVSVSPPHQHALCTLRSAAVEVAYAAMTLLYLLEETNQVWLAWAQYGGWRGLRRYLNR